MIHKLLLKRQLLMRCRSIPKLPKRCDRLFIDSACRHRIHYRMLFGHYKQRKMDWISWFDFASYGRSHSRKLFFFLFEIWNILIESSALSGGIIKHDSIIRCSRSNSMESFSPGKKIQARHPARGSKIVKFIWPCDYLFISTLHISASGSYSMHFSTPHGIQSDNKWFENKWFECWINWDEAHVSGAGSCFLCCSCCCCCVRTREGISWPDLQRYSQNS